MSFQCQNIVKKPTRGPKGRILPKSQWTETGPCYEGMRDGARPTRVVTAVRRAIYKIYFRNAEDKVVVDTHDNDGNIFEGKEIAAARQFCESCASLHQEPTVVETRTVHHLDGVTREEVGEAGFRLD